MCGLVLRVFRTFRSSQPRTIGNADWPALVPRVMKRINDVPYKGAKYSPRMCFLNPHTGSAKSYMTFKDPWVVRAATDEDIESATADTVWEEFREAYEELHKTHQDKRDRILLRYQQRKDQKFAHKENFEPGQWVLLARPSHKEGQKLSLRWTGPYKIISTISDYIFEISRTRNDGTPEIHRSHYIRMKLYCECDRGREDEIQQAEEAHRDEFVIDSIHQFRYNTAVKRFECLIYWQGFEPEEGSWEPIRRIGKDSPDTFTQAVLQH
eukprot:GHVU01122918.1.p1 GENE.GHVU01122918.1~~GHVU01122918.1.p1  ORF type:complete len:267 (+),score=16.78 GHVU01122918.1:139-939(+)